MNENVRYRSWHERLTIGSPCAPLFPAINWYAITKSLSCRKEKKSTTLGNKNKKNRNSSRNIVTFPKERIDLPVEQWKSRTKPKKSNTGKYFMMKILLP